MSQLHPKLMGYWPLDGDARDISGSGNHGTVNGAVLTVAPRGKGYLFNGDDTITLDATKLPQGDTSWTVCMWAWPLDASVAFGWGNAGQTAKCPHFDYFTTTLRFCGWNADFATSEIFGDDGNWHFYTFSHGGGLSYIYRDGRFYVSSSKTYGMAGGTALIGARPDGVGNFNGSISQLMVFSVRLELPDILRVMTGQMPIGV